MLTSCKIIDFNNVKMSIHTSCFCLGNDFFFQSKQLFTFFNRSVRLTFSAHEWSCQVMVLTEVKLLCEEKDIWRTPQERRVSFWWMHGWKQRTLYQITYISTLLVSAKWNIVTEIFQYLLFINFSTKYLFKEDVGNFITFLIEPFIIWSYLWLYSL